MSHLRYISVIGFLCLLCSFSCNKDLQPSPPLTEQNRNDDQQNDDQQNDDQQNDDQQNDDQQNDDQQTTDSLFLYANFESKTVELHPKHDSYNYSTVKNPLQNDVNSSPKCGSIILSPDAWDFIYTSPLDGTFNFSKYTTFRVKVYSQITGKVNFKLESSIRKHDKVEVSKTLTKDDTNKWIELIFHFRGSDIEAKGSDFDKFNILINADGDNHGSGTNFLIDDIYGPKLN